MLLRCASENKNERRENENEAEEQERAREGALPFGERTRWRKRQMYRGWMLEPIIEQVNERAFVTRSNYGYRVLNTPDLGMIDLDFTVGGGGDVGPQDKEALHNLGRD